MTYQLKKSIVLVGMMGCGKTTVGKVLARKLDVPFVDSDEEIEHASSYRIPDLFARFGEVYFREKETQVLLRLLSEGPKVLSTGGGAWMNHTNRVNIANEGVPVWIKAEVNLLWARLKEKTNRPLLRTDNPFETLSELYESRRPIYAMAPVHVPVYSSHSAQDTANAVVRELIKHDLIEEVPDGADS